MTKEDEVRRVRQEIEKLEAARLRLSEDVMRGKPEALEEDRRHEGRIRELAHWLMSVEREARREGR